MNYFKIVEIINGNTIRVSPFWEAINEETGQRISDDKVKISGLNTTKDDLVAMERLKVFLDKKVDLVAPVAINENLPTDAKIECTVLVENTNIVYYFPEYKNKQLV